MVAESADEGRGLPRRGWPLTTRLWLGIVRVWQGGLRRYARERCTGAPFGRAGYGFASRSKNCPDTPSLIRASRTFTEGLMA